MAVASTQSTVGARSVDALRRFLTHPLVLIAVGAAVPGLLIPRFTRQWQNHEQELKLKTDLVDR